MEQNLFSTQDFRGNSLLPGNYYKNQQQTQTDKATYAQRQPSNPDYHTQNQFPILASGIAHNQEHWEITYLHKLKWSLKTNCYFRQRSIE